MRDCLGSMLIGLSLVLCLAAQERPAEKSPSKETGKTAPNSAEKQPAKQYQFVNKITGKLSKVHSKDMTIIIELQVRQGKNNKTIHEEIAMADDVKIRSMKLPEQFDDKNKPKPY